MTILELILTHPWPAGCLIIVITMCITEIIKAIKDKNVNTRTKSDE